jgi:DNA-binding MarR family transcriptional regulator
MSRDTSTPTPRDPVASDLAQRVAPGDPERQALLDELSDLVRANQRTTDAVDDLVAQLLGVNRTDGRCLDLLEQHGRMSAGQLAAESGLTSGAITSVIDRLERLGYARRVPDPSDRRRVMVEPTDKAREMGWELFGPMVEEVAPVMARYTDEELRVLIDFQRLGSEVQERHAERLRALLAERRDRT